ncbi:MAG: hypothetical protein JHC84_09690 [Solirubrobacteraceae bacterium]|nr:hypothetical protein [Solirubrobacteraceae bacterium]
MLRRVLILTIASLAWGTAAAAAAAQSLEFTGDGAPAVVLKVSRDANELCLELNEGQNGEYSSSSCGPTTLLDLQDPWIRQVQAGTSVAGAVDAKVASVRYRLRTGGSVDMVARALPGLGGRLESAMRFFAGRLPSEDIRSIVMLDAAGTALAEMTADDPTFRQPQGTWTVRTVRAVVSEPTESWRVSATLRTSADPLPGQPLHRRRSVCVRAHLAGARGALACVATTGLVADPSFADVCGRSSRIVAGIVPKAGGRVVLVLGDGRRVRARTTALDGLGAPRLQAYAVRVPAGAAIREVELARAMPGATFALRLRRAPAGLTCAETGAVAYAGLGGGTLDTPAAGVAVPTAGGGDLYLAETSQDICIRIGAPPRGADCVGGASAVRLDGLIPAEAPGRLAGVVDPRVRSVQVRRRDGTVVVVPTAAPPAGAGPMLSRLRVFSYAGVNRRAPVSVRPVVPVGSAGWWPLQDAFEVRTGRVVGRAGSRDLRVQYLRLLGAPGQFDGRCLVLSTPAGKGVCPVVPNGFSASVDVRCDTGRALIAGVVPPRTRRVVAVRTDGSRLAATVLRTGPGAGLWYLAVPGSEAVAYITLLDRRGRRVGRVFGTIPAASEQCGYATWLDIRWDRDRQRPMTTAIRSYNAKTAAAVSPPLVPMNDSVMITR